MKVQSINKIFVMLIAVLLTVVAAGNVYGESYDSLKGVSNVKAVVDFRISNAKSAAVHLDLLLKTYHDKTLNEINGKPDFAVIFMGPSVKLLSSNRAGVSAEDAKNLDAIAATISQMNKDGIRLEVCLAAVKLLGVDQATLLPEVHQVPNGWISSIGYQLNGYALIPNF